MTPLVLHNLSIDDFRHPQEANSLRTLQNTRGIDKVIKKFYDMGFENILKMEHEGSSLKLTKDSFPQITAILRTACEVLGVDTVPSLYVERSDLFTAKTIGVDQPIIIISSECVDKLSNEELLFMLGREITHIKGGQLLYQEIGFIFPQLMDALSQVTLGLSGLLSTGVKYALFQWVQMAQYTADRGGLLACQDTYVVKQLMAKIAGLPEKYWHSFDIDDLRDQAKDFEGFTEKTMDNFIRFLYGNNVWAIARTHEMIHWLDDGEFNQIIARKSKKPFLF